MSDNWTVKHLAKTWIQTGGCWGLYRQCMRERFNIELPEHPEISIVDMRALARLIKQKQLDKKTWISVTEPKEGDCIIMSSVVNVFNHVGYYLGNGLVLHSTLRSNTGVTKLSNLDRVGYREYKIYRYGLLN